MGLKSYQQGVLHKIDRYLSVLSDSHGSSLPTGSTPIARPLNARQGAG